MANSGDHGEEVETLSLRHVGDNSEDGVELFNFGATASADFDEEELPPLSVYISKWRFWWHVVKWPLLVLLVNVIVVSILIVFDLEDQHDFYYDYPRHYHPMSFQRKRKVQSIILRNFVVASILLLMDAALLFRGGRHVEKQVAALENEENNAVSSSTTSSLVNAHAKASRMMDAFFSQGRRRSLPRVTLLVNLFFALSIVTLSVGVSSLVNAVFLLIPTTDMSNVCFGGNINYGQNETGNDPNWVDGVPEALQEWAIGGEPSNELDSGGLGSSFTSLADGTIFFAANKPAPSGSRYMSFGGNQILMEATPNRTVIAHHDVTHPYNFVSVSGPDDGQRQEFCLLYNPASDKEDNWYDYERNNKNVLCYSSEDHVMRNVTWIERSHRSGGYVWYDDGTRDAIVTSEGSRKVFWLRTTRYSDHAFGSHESILIHKLDVKTMNMTSIGMASRGGGWQRQMEKCASRFLWIDLAIAGAAAIGGSVWLLKVKSIPSGVLPICGYCLALLYSMDADVGFVIGLLFSIGATIGLIGSRLPARLGRDMLLWALYTDLVFMTILSLFDFDYDRGDMYSCITGVTLVLLGLILNHPLLQLFGWIGAIVTIVMAVIAFLEPDDEEILVLVPLTVLVSCGLASAGYYLSKYRLYMIVYSRRLWRALEATGRSANHRRRHERSGVRSTSQLQQGLLYHQEERP